MHSSDALSFYFLDDGEFMPPAFATAPTHVDCGVFAISMKLMLPLKASFTSASGILKSLFKRGWSNSLEGKSAKFDEEGTLLNQGKIQ